MTPPLHAEAFLFVPSRRRAWPDPRKSPTSCRALLRCHRFRTHVMLSVMWSDTNRAAHEQADEYTRRRVQRHELRRRARPARLLREPFTKRAPSQFRNASGLQYDPVQTH